jgi:hypothetical protein
MARLLWLADVLRAAGLTVYEVPGWRTRGDDSYGPVRGVIIHETRGSATSSDAGEIDVLVNGRVGLSGPIAQLYLSRTGAWHVVASGTCHHVRTGWGGPFNGLGNDALLGVEAQHGEAEDWAMKPVQYWSYVRGVAAILRHTGWPPPVGHKEHQPGDKPDPEFSMPAFRAQVAGATSGGVDDMNLSDSSPWGAVFTAEPGQDGPWLGGTMGNQLQYVREDAHFARRLARKTAAEVTALRSVVESLAAVITAGGGSVETAVIIEAMDAKLAELALDQRDAVADLGEGGAAQVRADQP